MVRILAEIIVFVVESGVQAMLGKSRDDFFGPRFKFQHGRLVLYFQRISEGIEWFGSPSVS